MTYYSKSIDLKKKNILWAKWQKSTHNLYEKENKLLCHQTFDSSVIPGENGIRY